MFPCIILSTFLYVLKWNLETKVLPHPKAEWTTAVCPRLNSNSNYTSFPKAVVIVGPLASLLESTPFSHTLQLFLHFPMLLPHLCPGSSPSDPCALSFLSSHMQLSLCCWYWEVSAQLDMPMFCQWLLLFAPPCLPNAPDHNYSMNE